jgi:S-formylglutathione hydrolase
MAETSRLIQAHFDSVAVNTVVEYRVLTPPRWAPGEPLPLVLHLHGAMSSSASLEHAQPLYEEAWGHGELPRAIVVCPSTPTLGGFYIDRPGALWESLVADALPQQLGREYGPFTSTALIGASMGGYGVLKIALRDPARYLAVAAISPAVFPGEAIDKVPGRNIPAVLGDLHRAMAADSNDPGAYGFNSVYGRARAHSAQILSAQLPILIDCGAEDEFLLHEGAGFLRGVLSDLGVPHEYRLVAGAGHMGESAERRTRGAIRFLGSALRERPTP